MAPSIYYNNIIVYVYNQGLLWVYKPLLNWYDLAYHVTRTPSV